MAAPARICHLVENLERGGLERMVIDLATEQAARGDKVDVLCLFEEGALAPELRRSGIPVTALGKRRGLDASVLRGIGAHLRAGRVAVLHTHNAMANYFGAIAALASPGTVVVNTRHGMGNAPHSLRRELLYRGSLARTAAVALVCRAAQRNFVAHRIVPRAKAQVVPNGIRIESFTPASAAARAEALARLGLPPDRVYVGSVGRLNPVKDQATMLRALAAARASRPELFLLLVGGGALMQPLVDLAAELGITAHVRFLGDRSDVPAILPALDLFTLTSTTEGYSMSLLEACAAALPIVATDVGGNREIVDAAGSGVMVPARDAEAIGRAYAELAADPARRAALGRAGRAWIERHGTLAAMAERYRDLYRVEH